MGLLGRAIRGFRAGEASSAESGPLGKAEVFAFGGYSIPLDLLVLTGGGPETFEEIATLHMRQLAAFTPIESEHAVLEIGCGIGRDAIPLTGLVRPPGTYIGIDIIRPSIKWCTDNISACHPHFTFAYLDVHDDLHNPGGVVSNLDTDLPAPDHGIDRVFGQSVFTHMFEDEITHYLSEFQRILVPGATATMSFFITDDDISGRPDPGAAIAMATASGDGCWVHDAQRPRAAVAFTAETIDRMARASGLVIRDIHFGSWSGRRPEPHQLCGQDVVVFSA